MNFQRPLLFSLIACTVLLLPIDGTWCRAASPPPNIIFILVDDLGYGDWGPLYQSQRATQGDRNRPWHMTPTLDRMAAEGMLLPHHYCSASVCAPSRASLLLGVHQGHANVRDNQFDKALEDNHTIPTVLKQAGYKTAAIGKYGLQGNAKKNPPDWPAHPNRRGFDEYYGYIRHGDGHEHYPKNGIHKGPKEVWHNDQEVSAGLDNCYTTDLFTARAKLFLAEHSRSQPATPFFMYLAYDTPHAVLSLPTGPYPAGGGTAGGLQWLGKSGAMINTANGTPDSYYHPDYVNATWDHDKNPATAEVAWPDVQKRYASLVRRIDDCVDDLFQTLRDLNYDDNTLVVFSSDNGPSLESYLKEDYAPTFFDSFGPFDGTKRDLWEGGVRVGAIARWPSRIKAGTSSQDWATTSWDWLPTFADAAGLPPPARSDGVSLVPLLTGTGKQPPSTVYVEYFQNGKTPNYDEFVADRRQRKRNQMQLFRAGNLVGVRYDIKSHDDDFEIYDIVADPGQRTNLAFNKADLQVLMKSQVLRLRRPSSEAPRPYDGQPVPALELAKSAPGLEWQFFAGNFPWVPSTVGMTATASGTSRHWNEPVATEKQAGLVVYRGLLDIAQTGEYQLYFSCDTKSLMRIHQATVIDADAGYRAGEEIAAMISLEAGLHPFTIATLQESDQPPMIRLQCSGSGIPRREIAVNQLVH